MLKAAFTEVVDTKTQRKQAGEGPPAVSKYNFVIMSSHSKQNSIDFGFTSLVKYYQYNLVGSDLHDISC